MPLRYDRPMAAAYESGNALAAVDIGSNSMRLEIGRVERGGRYRRIAYVKETVRLGAGLDAEGVLAEEAAERGLACLQRFAQRLAGFDAGRVHAVATQTLREAANRDAFVQRAQRALGRPIEIISGREEARLIFVGVGWLQPTRATRLVVDIGGRSTELVVGRGRRVQLAESFAVGCVGLSRRFFADGRITQQALGEAQAACDAAFGPAPGAFAHARWSETMGASGTVGALAHVLAVNGVSDGRITLAGLRWCTERCLEAGAVGALALAGLAPERRAVLPGGLVLLHTLFTHLGIETLQPARGALRHGVILELHERLATDARAAPGAPRRCEGSKSRFRNP